ncbi:MAG TPA: antibiotic biosynthesis monooxygenase [Candidatus Limnocylindrales bacterium]|nr:antibiotic biosynthesis monooxygenase [Candidatus Limnocylindrales bacterium]
MLVVAVTITAKPGSEAHLIEGVRKLVNDARGRPGLRYTKVARRIEEGRVRLLIIKEYESAADMQRFAEQDQAGAEVLSPFIESAEGGMWEAIDVEFDADSARPVFDELKQPFGFVGAG